MEIYIYQNYNQWCNDTPQEILEGALINLYNGLVAIDTPLDGKDYRQIFSTRNNFAFIYKMQYSFTGFSKEINIYLTIDSWQASKPEMVFNGEVCEDECSPDYFVFMSSDGYKQYISLNGIYSVVYER